MQASARDLILRLIALAAGIIGTGHWLYTFYAIAQVPEGDGTGMQWVAVVPLGFVYFGLIVPALVLSIRGRKPVLAAILGVLGLAAFSLLWLQVATEIAGR